MKKKSLFTKLIFLINILVAIALLVSLTLPYLEPEKYGVLSLLSLVVPVIIVLNVFFVIFWIIIGFRKQFFISLIVLAVSYILQPPIYKFNQENKSSQDEVKVFSFNVRKFNKNNWLNTKNIDKKIDSFITAVNPDIVAIQEYIPNTAFKLQYAYSFNNITRRNSESGLAIYSKFPIINSGNVTSRRYKNSIIYADIVKNNDTLRIYNFHLYSLGVDPDKDYFEADESKRIIRRLKRAFKAQQEEVVELREEVQSYPRKKMILTGDMNNTVHSWAYKTLSADYKDTFLEIGKGFGKTYDFNKIPLRIDYILVDQDISVNSHQVFDVKFSDHQPIMAKIRL